MIFQEQTYSVLVVSTQKFFETVSQMLPGSEYYPVLTVGNAAAARREMLSRSFDLVIINAPLPDEFGTRFAIDTARRSNCAVLLLVRGDVYEEVNAKVISHGVFTLSKPTPSQMLQQGLKWMCAARERLRCLEEKATSMEEKMEEIRLINRAKWELIEHLKMSEEDAHHFIERQAMDRCLPKREIAQGIIKTYTP